MFQQMSFFLSDYKRMCGRYWFRYAYVWMNRISVGIFLYRFERGMFLLLGKGWKLLRIIFIPILNILYAYSNCEIHYEAVIGPGLSVLHAAPGVVISGRSIIGKNFTLTGGNIIGGRAGKIGELKIGNDCSMGANAVILGPVTLGDHTIVGACALVVSSFTGDGILIGVPAKQL